MTRCRATAAGVGRSPAPLRDGVGVGLVKSPVDGDHGAAAMRRGPRSPHVRVRRRAIPAGIPLALSLPTRTHWTVTMTMSSLGSFGGPDPFNELLNRFFGMSPASSPPQMQRVPIGRLLTESARELIGRATARATEDGSRDLDTEHLLWAATQVDPARTLLKQAGADPDELGKRIAEVLPGESATPSAEPSLTAGRQARTAACLRAFAGGRGLLHRARAHPRRAAGHPGVRCGQAARCLRHGHRQAAARGGQRGTGRRHPGGRNERHPDARPVRT